jgi:predicted component of type VI protein secretion system
MTAGIQASLTDILKRFEPQSFEQHTQKGFLSNKKAECWEAYCRAYPKLAEYAQENLFGEEFADAYEAQIAALRGSIGK